MIKYYHSIIIAKLSLYSIQIPYIIVSLLSSEQISSNKNKSKHFPFHSGNPPGGLFSPILFAIFIMDISSC